ncbi:MAG: AbrB family transcriptional regulator [Chamaesiphon sp.]
MRVKNMAKAQKIKTLTGDELISKVKKLGNSSKEEKAKACGYYTITKNGVERVNMLQFFNALLNAEGVELDGKGEKHGQGGRQASYRISVQSNGNILIGAAYTKQLCLKPGDEFQIDLGRKHIHLKQITESGTLNDRKTDAA